jgi:hypothetical protein
MVVVPLMDTEKDALWVIVTEVEAVHPLDPVTSTEYVPGLTTVSEAVVAPVLHT